MGPHSPTAHGLAMRTPPPKLSDPSAPLLGITDLAAGYRTRKLTTVTLAGVTLEVGCGDLIALVGPNGAGKSTLLRTITGLHAPLDGRTELVGRNVASMNRRDRARHIALVLSERIEANGLMVRDVIDLGRHPYTPMSGTFAETDDEAVLEAIEATGVGPLLDRRVTELSDGERQRVSIARAVAQQPALLVLDEPTAYLDPRARVSVIRLLRDLIQAGRFAAIVSTHDLELVVPHCTAVWVAAAGTVVAGAPTDPIVRAAAMQHLGARFVDRDATTHVEYEV